MDKRIYSWILRFGIIKGCSCFGLVDYFFNSKIFGKFKCNYKFL